MNTNNHINYIELKSTDLKTTKQFYNQVFNWTFTDYGENYIAFSNSGIEGGFEKTEEQIINGSSLVVLYHKNLEKIKSDIEKLGCQITINIFSFPGGRRFHFLDPSGNELAIWSDQ